MASNDLMVGLEIGTSKICVVVGEGRPDGTIKILGVGQAPSRGVRKGEIVDFETAMKCVHEAVVDAETKSDVMIRSVYVGVAGSHIQSFNNRGCVMLPEDRDEIDEQDIEDVKINAREVSIPAQNAFLHSIIQHYHVDGQDGVLNPIGMLGQKLEADFHIIHGVRTRIQNTIRCVKELPLEVEDVVFTALASAQVVLTPASEKSGRARHRYRWRHDRLHSVCRRCGETKRRVSAVGGDHITNDISMGLRIPMARAEKLKIEEGSVTLGNCLPGETVLLKDDSGFAGKEDRARDAQHDYSSPAARDIRTAQTASWKRNLSSTTSAKEFSSPAAAVIFVGLIIWRRKFSNFPPALRMRKRCRD